MQKLRTRIYSRRDCSKNTQQVSEMWELQNQSHWLLVHGFIERHVSWIKSFHLIRI